MLDEGWQQISAGVALITWSRLASWDGKNCALVAVGEEDFESAVGHRQLHPNFGRLIAWIAFSVGSEYVLKGACLVKGISLAKTKTVLRAPERNGDVQSWVSMVKAKNTSVSESTVSFGTLGELPVDKLLDGIQEKDRIKASIELLRQSVRNRDAHRYTMNVRAFHFHALGSLFVPALNSILISLGRPELAARLSG